MTKPETKLTIFAPVVTVFVLCVGLTACGGSTEAKNSAPALSAEDAAPVVRVVKVARENLSNDIVLTAEFIPYQEVDVMAKVAGYIKTIGVDIGDRVKEGEPIATLEVPEMQDELNKAAFSIQAAEAEIANADNELGRAESAHQIAHLSWSRIEEVSKKEVGLVPQQEVDEAQSRDLQAEAQVAGAKSRLREAQQKADIARGEQSRLKTMFRYTSITAPFEGVVTKRYANAGSMIQAGTASQTQAMPVVRLSQNNLLRLVVPVPESAVPNVHKGGAVEVNVPAMHRTFKGRVVRFADTLQLATRTMDTEIDVPNSDLLLVPGMYAEVNLRIEERNNALAVPLDAVDGSGADARAYKVSEAGVIQIVPVTTGIQTPRRVEIRSGVAAGDEVIIDRHAALRDGQKVHPSIVNPDQE